jgi:hypothetical protein
MGMGVLLCQFHQDCPQATLRLGCLTGVAMCDDRIKLVLPCHRTTQYPMATLERPQRACPRRGKADGVHLQGLVSLGNADICYGKTQAASWTEQVSGAAEAREYDKPLTTGQRPQHPTGPAIQS